MRGIVRAVDGLGRVTLPMEWRKALELKEQTPVEMVLTGDGILIIPYKKRKETCPHCGEELTKES